MIKKLFVLTFVFAAFLPAITVVSNEDVLFNINGTIQGLAAVEFTDDFSMNITAYSNNMPGVSGTNVTYIDTNAVNGYGKDRARITLFLKQARMDFNGRIRNTDFRMELAFGGEMIPSSSSSVNSILALLDGYGNTHFFGDALQLRFGQFLVPYSRERLTRENEKMNADFSLNNLGFDIGRDVGLALHSRIGLFTGALGVFTAGGIDVPQRYLPEVLGLPLTVARLGINTGLDKDAFTPNNGEAEGLQFAAYLNAAATYKNSRIGHGTALGTRYYTAQYGTGLLLNSKWNILGLATNYFDSVLFYQVGMDAAVRIPVTKDIEVKGSVEANYGKFINAAVGFVLWGGVADAMIMMKTTPLPMVKNVGIGIRYSLLQIPNGMVYAAAVTNGTYSNGIAIPGTLMQEITPTITFQIFDLKCIGELAIQRDMLVTWERGNGSYNISLMPNQVSTGNFLVENPVILRGLVQYTF